MTMKYTISGIEYLPDQGSGRWSKRSRQLYVKITIDGIATLVPLEGEMAKFILFDASKSNNLRIEVYSKHRFRPDHLIGCIQDSVERLSGHPNGVVTRALEKKKSDDGVIMLKSSLQFEIQRSALGAEVSSNPPPPSITVTEPSVSVPGAPSTTSPAIGQAHASKDDRLTPAFPNSNSSDGSSMGLYVALTSDISKTGLSVESAKETIDKMKFINSKVSRPAEVVERFDSTTQQTGSVCSSVTSLLEKLQVLSNMGDMVAQVHPYVTVAWNALTAVYKAINAAIERDEKVKALVETMDIAFSFLQVRDTEPRPITRIQSREKVVSRMLVQLAECSHFICDYGRNPNFWSRGIKNAFADVDARIDEFRDKFYQLNQEFLTDVAVQTELTVLRMVNTVESMAVQIDLNGMQYANGAGYRSEKECLPNTRFGIIDEIIAWVCNPNEDGTCVFWLHGVAGSGKSSITHTIARIFKEEKRLGSFFAFDIAYQADRQPRQLFSTIAVDLADLDHEWRTSLWNIIKDNRALRTTVSVQTQFEEFILKVSRSASLKIIGPIVLVIDGLDECDSREDILVALGKKIIDLPHNFRIILASRPEKDILDMLSQKPHVHPRSMADINGISTDRDISAFIWDQLHETSVDKGWPNQWRERLVEKSEHLFQWASTACWFVRDQKAKAGYTPTERLEMVLSDSVTNLDSLYMKILERTFGTEMDETAMNRFKTVLGMILLAETPLTVSSLRELCNGGLGPDVVGSILDPLGALLTGVAEQLTPVRPLHTSFHDFLTDPNRGGSFYIEPSFAHRALALGCLHVLQRGLRLDIFGLKSSYPTIRNVPDLIMWIETNIAPHLHYSCHFWVYHLTKTAFEAFTAVQVRQFLQKYYLYWVEAMHVMGRLDFLQAALESIHDSQWGKPEVDSKLSVVISHALGFFRRSYTPAAMDASYICISRLAFERKVLFRSKAFVQLKLFHNTLSVHRLEPIAEEP